MTVSEKIKETVVENLVQSVLIIFGILALILWSAVPTTFWQSISDAIDKRVLWALVALLFLIAIGEAVYIVGAIIKARRTLYHFSGVLWNTNCDFFCPKDETPLYQSGRTDHESGKGVEIFQCPKCDSDFIFKNSDGLPISVADAKRAFLIKQTVGQKGSSSRPAVVESFDESTSMVLRGFAGTTSNLLKVGSFTGMMSKGIKPVRIAHSLDLLHKKGLLNKRGEWYELTPQGREYIIQNGLA